MKAIGKFFKFIFWTVIVLVLLAVVAVLTIPWWIGPAVTGVSNCAVPKIVKTDFALNRFEFNQYKGTFGLGQMTLANPEGFEPENCLELDAFDVKFDPVSCFTKKVRIEKITLDGLRVIVDFPAAANFQKIADNANETCGCGEEEKEEKPEEKETKEEKDATKVVIDFVEIKNLKVTYGAAPIVVPDFELKDIGKEDNGVNFDEACAEIYKAVCEKCGIVVGAVLDAGKVVVDKGVETANAVIDIGSDAANAAIDAVGNIDAQGAVDAVKEGASAAGDAIKDGASSALDIMGDGASAAKDGASAAASAVGDFMGNAANSAGDAVGKGLNAVGDGAGAAVDAVKGFLK